MNTHSIAALMGGHPTAKGEEAVHGIVEIGLLLPANRAAALLKLAKNRDESVGQVLRRMIDHELVTIGRGAGLIVRSQSRVLPLPNAGCPRRFLT